MTDYDYEASAAGLKLVQKANRVIEARRVVSDKPGADWHVKESVSGYEGTPRYNGAKGTAALYATEDGTAYEVNVYSYAGKLAHKATRKTLDAAFKLGQKLANQELPKEEQTPAPVVAEVPTQAVDEPAAEWAATTLKVTYANGADGREENLPASVNRYGLYVLRERAGGPWQVANSDGLRVKSLIGSRKAARALADRIGPAAPYGWTSAGVQKWRSENPDARAEIGRLVA